MIIGIVVIALYTGACEIRGVCMNKIQNEYKESTQFDFDLMTTNDGNSTKLVKINIRNVALAEAMIRNDSSYIKESLVLSPENSDRKGAYGGSVKYWVKQIKNVIDGNVAVDENGWRNIINKLVVAIDLSNSTHLNSDGVGVKQITDSICKIDRNRLVEMVKYPQKDDYKLIKIITEKTTVNDGKHHARTNYSFATKFCRALCMTLFDGEEEQDNFSIYDSVVAEAIWHYIRHFNIKVKKADLKDYAKFINIIDYIIEKSDKNVSRNGFDHLIWYYYKGRSKSFFNY